MSFTVEVTGFIERDHARQLAEQLARNAPPSLVVRIVPGDSQESDRIIETIPATPASEFVAQRTEATDAKQE